MSARVNLPLKCRCGAVRGVARNVAPEVVNRVVCYCRGCRRYAEVLGCEEMVLDERGGTDVINLSPAQLAFEEGEQHVACLKITRKGPLRWYAACCDTPLANTFAGAAWPFVGLLHHACVDVSALDEPIEAYAGPVRVRVNGTFTRAEARERKANVAALLRMLWHYAPLFFRWKLRGDQLRSPFFDPDSREPIRQPRELEPAKPRHALARGCD